MRGIVGRADIVSLLARAGTVLLAAALVGQLLVSAIAVDPVDPAAAKGLDSFAVSLLRGSSAGAFGASLCVAAVLVLIVVVRGVRLAWRRLGALAVRRRGRRAQRDSATERASATR
jgi:ABC-type sulfate transport system permease subunit